jgi:hypothetical protein
MIFRPISPQTLSFGNDGPARLPPSLSDATSRVVFLSGIAVFSQKRPSVRNKELKTDEQGIVIRLPDNVFCFHTTLALFFRHPVD